LWPGGARHSPPKDRVDITDVWILRVYDYVAMKAHMPFNRVHQVNTLEMAGGWLDCYADPEGHLFGFQERKAQTPNLPTRTSSKMRPRVSAGLRHNDSRRFRKHEFGCERDQRNQDGDAHKVMDCNERGVHVKSNRNQTHLGYTPRGERQ
jgi:hypothetical protein